MAGTAEAPRRVEEIVERLTELGLDEAEARAYLYVSSVGPSKAGELARGLRVARGEAYRVLQRLVERDFLSASLSRPVEFSAVPVDQLFDDVLEQERRRLDRLEESQAEIRGALARLQAGSGGGRGGASFVLLHGRKKIFAVAERMTAGAARLDVVSAHPAARAWRSQWPRLQPGAKMRALVSQRDLAPPGAAASLRRLADDVPIGLLLVDDAELLVWITHDPSSRLGADGDVAFWSDAPDLVALNGLLFGALWASAEPLEVRELV